MANSSRIPYIVTKNIGFCTQYEKYHLHRGCDKENILIRFGIPIFWASYFNLELEALIRQKV